MDHARAELTSVLPPGVLRHVDLATLELAPGEFVDAALAASYSDLLYRVRVSQRPGLVYILFEHQSSQDELMPLRLLGYVVGILELEARARAADKEPILPMPIVLPLVLHHSEQGWTRAARFEDLFDATLMQEPELARLNGVEALRVIFRYISVVTEERAAQRVLEIVLEEAPLSEETMTTLAEKWKSEGEAKGRTEGEAKGRTEGKTDGRRLALGQLLALKFGAVPPTFAARVASGSEADLERWTARVLSQVSLDGVFED
jgi:predicted transposase YdaD